MGATVTGTGPGHGLFGPPCTAWCGAEVAGTPAERGP
jgi:hypothetical protein